MLLLSLSAWIIFTLPLGFIQPPPTGCLERQNNSVILKTTQIHTMFKREVQQVQHDNHPALFLLTHADLNPATSEK